MGLIAIDPNKGVTVNLRDINDFTPVITSNGGSTKTLSLNEIIQQIPQYTELLLQMETVPLAIIGLLTLLVILQIFG